MLALIRIFLAVSLLSYSCLPHAQTAGAPGPDPLQIVAEGRPLATVIVAAGAGELETTAAADLVK